MHYALLKQSGTDLYAMTSAFGALPPLKLFFFKAYFSRACPSLVTTILNLYATCCIELVSRGQIAFFSFDVWEAVWPRETIL